MSQFNYSRYKYTPDEIDETEFLSKFVVRNEEFNELFSDLKTSDYAHPNQHYIIIGQRGQGKTTLLRKIKLAVEGDDELSPFLLPIKFSEEQYQIRTLSRLWEEVADYLQACYSEFFPTILDDLELHFDDKDYELQCFSYLEQALKLQNKKLLLLIDNIDELLGKFKEKEQRRLREILLTSSSFRIVGGSTKMLEEHFDYAKPFFEFFSIIKIKGLDKAESIRFLQAIGNQEQTKKINKLINNEPQRIETLRRLTGGVPRTMVMLFDIFLDNSDNALDDLLKVLDDATPLYKHRMDDLPNMLQDITHVIAMNWDGMLTKDIAKKTRLESKVVSAQLKQLEQKYGIVESESIGKNKIYKLEERFFNIWYLMRFGRNKDRQKVEWLVKFLMSWCSPKELEDRASRLMTSVNEGKVKESEAYYMCEALGYSGLDMETEHLMKDTIKKYLISQKSHLASEVSASDFDLLNIIDNEKDYDKAISYLKKSQKNSPAISFYYGYLYTKKFEFEKAEKYLILAMEGGFENSKIMISILYLEQGIKINKAIELIENIYDKTTDGYFLVIAATINLWGENFTKSIEGFLLNLSKGNEARKGVEINLFLMLLIAKGQYYKAKELFEMPEHSLKDQYKPIWYALMTLMQDDFPHEIKKMGSELKESVAEVLVQIEEMKIKYALPNST